MVWKLVWKLVITVILCKLSNLKFKLGYLLDSGEIFIQPKQRGLHQYQGRYLLDNTLVSHGWNVFLSQNGGLDHFTDWVTTNQSLPMEVSSRKKAYCTCHKKTTNCGFVRISTHIPPDPIQPYCGFGWLKFSLIAVPLDWTCSPSSDCQQKWVDNFKSQLIKSWLSRSGKQEGLLIEIGLTLLFFKDDNFTTDLIRNEWSFKKFR